MKPRDRAIVLYEAATRFFLQGMAAPEGGETANKAAPHLVPPQSMPSGETPPVVPPESEPAPSPATSAMPEAEEEATSAQNEPDPPSQEGAGREALPRAADQPHRKVVRWLYGLLFSAAFVGALGLVGSIFWSPNEQVRAAAGWFGPWALLGAAVSALFLRLMIGRQKGFTSFRRLGFWSTMLALGGGVALWLTQPGDLTVGSNAVDLNWMVLFASSVLALVVLVVCIGRMGLAYPLVGFMGVAGAVLGVTALQNIALGIINPSYNIVAVVASLVLLSLFGATTRWLKANRITAAPITVVGGETGGWPKDINGWINLLSLFLMASALLNIYAFTNNWSARPEHFIHFKDVVLKACEAGPVRFEKIFHDSAILGRVSAKVGKEEMAIEPGIDGKSFRFKESSEKLESLINNQLLRYAMYFKDKKSVNKKYLRKVKNKRLALLTEGDMWIDAPLAENYRSGDWYSHEHCLVLDVTPLFADATKNKPPTDLRGKLLEFVVD